MFSWKIAKFFLEQEIEQDIKKKKRDDTNINLENVSYLLYFLSPNGFDG